MYCIKCGAENDDQDKYCYACGTPLLVDVVAGQVAKPPGRLPTLWQGITQWPLQRQIVATAGLLAIALILVVGIRAVIGTEEPSLPRSLATPQATRAVERSQTAFRSESAQRFMTEDEFRKLATVGSYFTNPRTREVITGEIKLGTLFLTPSSYDGKTVTIAGKVLKKTLVLDVLPHGWPASYYLIIDDGTDSLPVLYRGDARAIDMGDTVRVTGLFSEAGSNINADAIQKLDSLTSFVTRPILLISAYLLATVLLLILMAFSLRTFRRRRARAKQ